MGGGWEGEWVRLGWEVERQGDGEGDAQKVGEGEEG